MNQFDRVPLEIYNTLDCEEFVPCESFFGGNLTFFDDKTVWPNEVPNFGEPAPPELFAEGFHNKNELPFQPEETPTGPDREFFKGNINVLEGKDLALLYGNTYYLYTMAKGGVLLFKDAKDNQKYFLYSSEDYKISHPFDTPTLYELFDAEERNKFLLAQGVEFIHDGRNLFDGLQPDPWYVDKGTGEVKSLFKFDESRLQYKIGGQKFFLKRSENFEKSYPYKFMFEQTYGYKIQGTDNAWYYECNPKRRIYLGCITSCDGAFLDIISYKAVYEKEWEKYDLLKKSVFRLLADIISKDCECKTSDICIPHKAIACVFKCNSDKIDGIIKRLTSNRTKTGKISKKKPVKFTPCADILRTIGIFARMMNHGHRPDMDFYDCNACQSESVCIWKAHMTKFYDAIEKAVAKEILGDYIRAHKGQIPLFPPDVLQKLSSK